MSLSQSLYGEKKDVMYLTADATSLADLKVKFINGKKNVANTLCQGYTLCKMLRGWGGIAAREKIENEDSGGKI